MTIVNDVAGLPEAFANFCATRGIVYEPVVRRDMLASTLASQLVLLAGPSGTGKSTGARVLSEFFTPAGAIRTIDVRPLWTGPENLVGYFSALTETYDEVDGLQPLLALGASPATSVPFMIIEEANLSPMEVYLGNIVTSLSGLRSMEVEFRLHWRHQNPPTVREVDLPLTVSLKPFPRFMATINVDSTADAPSAKVCGRGITLLLEAPSVALAASSTQAIAAPEVTPAAPPGAAVMSDPRGAWFAFVAAHNEPALVGALGTLCEKLKDDLGANYVSPRDMQRCVMFMAWHVGLAEHEADFTTLEAAAVEAAELALLHVALPGFGSGQFGMAVQSLKKHALAGGLLDQRLDRVLTSTKGIYGAPPDFWAALS